MPGRARSIRPFLCTSLLALLAQPVAAEDLMQVFREAQKSDAEPQAAHPEYRSALQTVLQMSA